MVESPVKNANIAYSFKNRNLIISDSGFQAAVSFFLLNMGHAMTFKKSYKTIRGSKLLVIYLELFRMNPVGKRFCLCETALLLLGSEVERMVPRIYLLAVGVLFIFKLKTHHYLGKAYLRNIWRKICSGNKAAFASEHLKGSCTVVVLNTRHTNL